MEPQEDKEEAEDGVRVDTVNREVGQLGDLVDLAIIVVIFFISCVTVVGVCVIVILAGYKVGRYAGSGVEVYIVLDLELGRSIIPEYCSW